MVTFPRSRGLLGGSLRMNPETDWKGGINVIVQASKREEAANWEIGDTLCRLIDRYSLRDPEGRPIGQMWEETREGKPRKISLFARAAQETGLSRMKLEQCFRVARAIGEDLRTYEVSWAHFRAAAQTDQPEAWLRRAAVLDWTPRQLRDAIEDAAADTAIRTGPQCLQCQGELPSTPLSLRWGKRTYLFCKPACLRAFDWPED